MYILVIIITATVYCTFCYIVNTIITLKIVIALLLSQRAIYSYKCWRKPTPFRFRLETASVFHWSPWLRSLTAAPRELLPPTVAHVDLARLPSASAELRRRAHRGDENKHALCLTPKCLTQASKETNTAFYNPAPSGGSVAPPRKRKPPPPPLLLFDATLEGRKPFSRFSQTNVSEIFFFFTFANG